MSQNSDDSCHAPDSPEIDVDKEKLANLVKRRRIYGDIAQSAESEDELEKLLKKYNNKVRSYSTGDELAFICRLKHDLKCHPTNTFVTYKEVTSPQHCTLGG